MAAEDIAWILMLVLPIGILAIKQHPTQEVTQFESLPDAGSDKTKYRHVLDVSNRQFITFSVRSDENCHLLLSEKKKDETDFSTDPDIIEIAIGNMYLLLIYFLMQLFGLTKIGLYSQNRTIRQIVPAGIHCKTAVWKRL